VPGTGEGAHRQEQARYRERRCRDIFFRSSPVLATTISHRRERIGENRLDTGSGVAGIFFSAVALYFGDNHFAQAGAHRGEQA